MSNFARVNSDNKVVDVVFVFDDILTDDDGNLHEHWAYSHLYETYPDSNKDYWVMIDNKKNWGYVGNTFDRVKDGFISEKPYLAWSLDENTLKWIPPVPEPILTDEEKEVSTITVWDEELQMWEKTTLD